MKIGLGDMGKMEFFHIKSTGYSFYSLSNCLCIGIYRKLEKKVILDVCFYMQIADTSTYMFIVSRLCMYENLLN